MSTSSEGRRQAALIILFDGEGKVLLQHRTEDARLLPGHWAFFGGGIKRGEDPLQAVRREAFEELFYRPEAPVLIGEEDFRIGDTEGHLFIFVEEFLGDKGSLRLNEGQDWGWFGEEDLPRLKMLPHDREIARKALARAQQTVRGSGLERMSR